jgi:hypothetical protein
MTAAKKTGWTLASLVAAVVLVAGAWPQVEPIATWAMGNLGVILGREQVQAVLAAMAIGVLAGVFLPSWLPPHYTAARTRAITGLVTSAMAFSAALGLVPTRVGLVYAVLAAVATPTASAAVRAVWYWARPCAKPASLQP